MADTPRVSVADLADGAADGPVLDEAGQVTEPLMVVDLDGGARQAVLERAAARGRESDRLLVGIASEAVDGRGPLPEALDLTLAASGDVRECVTVADPDAEARVLGQAVAGNPQASLVLGQLLRATETLEVPAALDVESFAYSTLLGGPEFRRWLGGRGERPPPPLAEMPVIVRWDGTRLRITLNRPERRNAYGRQLRDALTDALRVALLDEARVVLDGAGPCFCSGGDLDEFGTTPDLVTAHFIRARAGAGRLIHRLGARIEARVHGPCIGAGVELAAFAGTVVAAGGSTFRLPETGMGLILGAGGTVSIPRRIGRWRTLYLALTGRPLDAPTALAWGLVDRVDHATFLSGVRPGPARCAHRDRRLFPLPAAAVAGPPGQGRPRCRPPIRAHRGVRLRKGLPG
jgi:enoyl-CoA hydratase/carnithine racemase